jgi:ABC-2 type transport system permease protein
MLRGVPILVAYAFIFDISHPHDISGWAAFGLALVLAWLVSFSWRFLVNLAALWTPNALGVGRLAFIVSWFLSGFMMPLRFFPDWFVNLCYLTPFPHMVNTIIEVYLGLLKGPQLVVALSAQAAWVVILVIAARIVLGAGVRRLVILGG